MVPSHKDPCGCAREHGAVGVIPTCPYRLERGRIVSLIATQCNNYCSTCGTERAFDEAGVLRTPTAQERPGPRCGKANGISRGMSYPLLGKGRALATIKLGHRRLISREETMRWREQITGAEAAWERRYQIGLRYAQSAHAAGERPL